MQTMHPTVLIGPADWNEVALPRSEYDRRVRAVFESLTGVDVLLVYGSVCDHAALAWFTHLTPKLEHALALIPRNGSPELFVGGGPSMLPAARPLSFVESMQPLGDAKQAITSRQNSNVENCKFAMVNFNAMPEKFYTDLIGDSAASFIDADRVVSLNMKAKSESEILAVKGACQILGAAEEEMRKAARAGKNLPRILIAGERAAYANLAQDVRMLFSPDGGLTLFPFETNERTDVPHSFIYVAVRQEGYWADGIMNLGTGGKADAHCVKVLLSIVDAVRPGMTLAQLNTINAPYHLNTSSVPAVRTIGLSLSEPALENPLAENTILSVSVGMEHDGVVAAASCLVRIIPSGAEILWKSSMGARI